MSVNYGSKRIVSGAHYGLRDFGHCNGIRWINRAGGIHFIK